MNKSIIIIIGCFLGVINVIISLSFNIGNIEIDNYFIINNIIALVCIIGIWKMKIWAVFAYISAIVVNQAILMFCNQWNVLQVILPFIVISIALKKIDEMG